LQQIFFELQVAEFHVIVDPKLHDWFLYTSSTKSTLTTTASTTSVSRIDSESDITKKFGKSLQTGTSDRETRKPTSKNVTQATDDTASATLSKRALAFISTWFPTLNAALVQVWLGF